MEIQGKWRGFYEYGLGYTLPHFGQRVEMEIVFKGENDSFTGDVTEMQTEYSVDMPGKVNGFVDNDFISFTKAYPKTAYLKEHSTEQIIKDGELEIVHEGYFDEETYSIYGVWEIIDKSLVDDEDYINGGQGIWLLKKVY